MALRLGLSLLAIVGLLAACGGQPSAVPTPSASPQPTETAAPTAIPTSAPTEPPTRSPTPTAIPLPPTATSPPASGCRLGLGMRVETVPVLLAYQNQPGLVMTASARLAADHFSEFEGWIRVLGAPSLAMLEQKAARAEETGLAYEALAYGLETNESTPGEEWLDLVGSTERARALADRYGKLLLMGPGFRLMSENEEMYTPMAALADIWMFQTQRLQLNPPGADYRREVARVVDLIRAGNPDISVWVQITLPPDREPDAAEWLDYRRAIADLVDGAYVGVYTWRTEDADRLVGTVEQIFQRLRG